MSAQSSVENEEDVAEETGESVDGTEESDAEPRALSKDDMFHLLQNARRRAVLRYLAEQGEKQFVMRDVAEAVAAWEYDTTVAQLTSDQRQRVYIALYQSHLPKLDEHDVIEYDQNRGVVEPTPLTDVFKPYLEEGLHASSEYVVGAIETGDEEGSEESDLTDTVRSLFRL